MLKVTIVSDELRTQKYVSKRDGKPAELYFQTAYVHTIDKAGKPAPFPEKVEFFAERDERTGNPVAHPRGEYTLHPSAVYIDRDGRLAASMRLTPLAPAAKG